MNAIIISGAAPWDGRYDFDDFAFTNRELFEIKKLSGLRAGELIEALDANDTSAYVGIAMIVMGRHGLKLDADDLWNAPVGSIVIELGDAEDADDPPTTSAAEGAPTSSAESSGEDSKADGESLASDPKRTGGRG